MGWFDFLFKKYGQQENLNIAEEEIKMDEFQPYDQREADLLAALYQPFAEQVKQLLKTAREQGLMVYIFEAERSMERQAALYAQGRDGAGNIVDKKKVVTYAKPGSSFHNYKLAVDLVFDGDQSKPKIQWSWDGKLPWSKLGALGESFGLEWAGHWKNFVEFPHFQWKTPYKASALKAEYDKGGIEAVFKLVA